MCLEASPSLMSFTNVNKTTKYGSSVLLSDALYSHWCRRERQYAFYMSSSNQSSVDDFIDRGLLVPGASDDELVIGGDITAEN